MSFSSQIYASEPIIDESTPVEIPADCSTGLELGFRTTPYGEIPSAPPFPEELSINPSEFQDRIREKEETKTRTSDLIYAAKMPHKDQDRTNYCWINAPVHAVETTRLIHNLPYVSLSPASCGGPIKNFRNVGGWGEEGLEYIVEHGIVPTEYWPDNAISRQYWTEENKKRALDFRVTEWMELQPHNMNQMISCLLHNIPVAVGYNWWGHEVLAVDAVWLDGTVAIRIRNSWKAWGDFGFGILQGNRMRADDAVCARVAIAA